MIVGEAFVLVRPDTTPFMPELSAKMAGLGPGVQAASAAGIGGGVPVGTDMAVAFSAATQSVEKDTEKGVAAWQKFAQGAEESSAKSGGAFSGMANLIGLSSTKITGASNVASDALGSLDKSGLGASSSIAGLAGPAGAAAAAILALVAVVGGGVFEFTKFGNAALDIQERTGISIDQASRLAYAFNLAGVQVDQASTLLVRFSRNLENGVVDTHRFGLELAYTSNGAIDTYGSLLNLADAMQRLGPGAEADSLALQALGRSGSTLIPILLQGRQAIEALMAATPQSLVFSEADAQRAREFSIQLRQLKADFEAIFVAIGKEVMPAIIQLVSVFDLAANHLIPVVEWSFKWLSGLGLISQALHAFGVSVGGTKDGLIATIDAIMKQNAAQQADADSAQQAADKTKTLTDALNALSQAAASVVDDERNLQKAQESRKTAQDDLVKAEKDYNDLLKVNGADVTAYEAAVRRLRDAQLALEQANNDVAASAESVHEKEEALSTAIDQFGQNSDEARKAAVDLNSEKVRQDEANNRVKNSSDDIKSAMKDEADAMAGSAKSVDRLSAAHDKVVAAQKSVDDALYSEASAAAALKENMDAVAGHTDTAHEKTLNLITALQGIANQLDPGSPTRKNLDGYIAQLQAAANQEASLAQQAGLEPTAVVPHSVLAAHGEQSSLGNTNIIVVNGAQDPAQTAAAIDAYIGGGGTGSTTPSARQGGG